MASEDEAEEASSEDLAEEEDLIVLDSEGKPTTLEIKSVLVRVHLCGIFIWYC